MNDENKRLKIFGITSNPWLRDIRSFLCALRPANLSMWSFSLFLSFTATLSTTVTPSNKTCPASTIKPQVSSILAHPRRVRDDYARTNCWPSYTTEWHSTLTHGSTFVLQYHPLSFPDHLMYLALCEKPYATPEGTTALPWYSARGRNWERMFLSPAQSWPRDKAVVFECSNVAICLSARVCTLKVEISPYNRETSCRLPWWIAPNPYSRRLSFQDRIGTD